MPKVVINAKTKSVLKDGIWTNNRSGLSLAMNIKERAMVGYNTHHKNLSFWYSSRRLTKKRFSRQKAQVGRLGLLVRTDRTNNLQLQFLCLRLLVLDLFRT